MAEVYRAWDTRLQREVAVKVVGGPLSADGGFLSRLEQEARLAGSLNHPNIVSVYDVGVHDGSPYVVTELLQGETLRQRLAKGAVPLSSALEWAVQMAQGLAAAHEHGIVHRDLKPENVFLTRSGQLKLLDFGIAKAVPAVTESRGLLEPTLSPAGSATSTGVVLGTPGYMSPEQVRAEPADDRSDIFSLGAMLYELLSGQRPFRGSVMESGYAVLHLDPPALPASVPAPVANLVNRCLAKDPEQRFETARDLAFSLEALRTVSWPVAAAGDSAAAPPRRGPSRMFWPAVAVLMTLLASALGIRALRSATEQPTVKQLTFRRGSILAARFAPDGRTVHFSAAWSGGAPEVYSTTIDSPEVRPLGVGDAQLLSVSPSGELAVSLRPKFALAFDGPEGTLARVPPLGGTPREVATRVAYADWAPDGERLAAVRVEGTHYRLEYPLGTVRFESSGWISHPRVSHSGELVAFVNHPDPGDTAGEVMVIGPEGKPERWSGGVRFDDVLGLVWRPREDGLLVSAARVTELDALWTLRRGSAPRVVYRAPGNLLVNDLNGDGRVLVTARDWRSDLDLFHPGDASATPLGWFDWGSVSGISDDGNGILFHDSGTAGGRGMILLRNPAQPAPANLGPGRSLDLSPDGEWAAAVRADAPARLWLLPTGPGSARSVDVPGLDRIIAGGFFRDGKRMALLAQAGGSTLPRLYVLDLDEHKVRPISPPVEYDLVVAVSPDERWVAATGADGILTAYPVEVGEPMRATELGSAQRLAGWLKDGSILAFERYAFPSQVRRFDPRKRTITLFTTLAPADRTGTIPRLNKVRVTPDGRTFAFHFRRMSGALYVLDWGGSPP
jgi:hypothetical protein